MPRQYLIDQLRAFQKGTRRNDAQAQMRNMVRSMTAEEIDEVATFYARKAKDESETARSARADDREPSRDETR
jgi:cytochrome c553